MSADGSRSGDRHQRAVFAQVASLPSPCNSGPSDRLDRDVAHNRIRYAQSIMAFAIMVPT